MATRSLIGLLEKLPTPEGVYSAHGAEIGATAAFLATEVHDRVISALKENSSTQEVDIFELSFIKHLCNELIADFVVLSRTLSIHDQVNTLFILEIFVDSHVKNILRCLNRPSGKDELTDLRGIVFAEKLYKTELEYLNTHQEKNQTLAIARIDLDRLRDINSLYGHGFADFVIRTIALAMSQSLRIPGQMAFRAGGDEFIAVIGRIPVENAKQVLERIYADFLEEFTNIYKTGVASFANSDKPIPETFMPTCSTGVYIFDPSNPVDFEVADNHADNAAYSAKQSGRNKLMFYSA